MPILSVFLMPVFEALGFFFSLAIDYMVFKWSPLESNNLETVVRPVSIFLVILLAYRAFEWII